VSDARSDGPTALRGGISAAGLGRRSSRQTGPGAGLLGRHLLLDLRVGSLFASSPCTRRPRDPRSAQTPASSSRPAGVNALCRHPYRPLPGPDGNPALLHPPGERPVRALHRPHRDGRGDAAALPFSSPVSPQRWRRTFTGGRRRPVGIRWPPASRGIGGWGGTTRASTRFMASAATLGFVIQHMGYTAGFAGRAGLSCARSRPAGVRGCCRAPRGA